MVKSIVRTNLITATCVTTIPLYCELITEINHTIKENRINSDLPKLRYHLDRLSGATLQFYLLLFFYTSKRVASKANQMPAKFNSLFH